MLILGIESSCDETAAAIVRDGQKVVSSEVFSQVALHAPHGGVVPEIASRNHIKNLVPLTQTALEHAGLTLGDIDAVAVTYAPGLIGALLTGLNFAKGLAFALDKPLIPVHHLRAHVAANYLAFPELEPPFALLMASGGHTLIADVTGYTDMKLLGSTRDDAAGEMLDKIAREAGLGYPGGAKLDALAAGVTDAGKYRIPLPSFEDAPYDFSFSGIKTAAVNLMHNLRQKGEEPDIQALASALNRALCDILVPRAIAAAKALGRDTLVAAGGVVANSHLRARLKDECRRAGIALFLPPAALCGDNAAMVAAQGYFEFLSGNTAPLCQNAFASKPL